MFSSALHVCRAAPLLSMPARRLATHATAAAIVPLGRWKCCSWRPGVALLGPRAARRCPVGGCVWAQDCRLGCSSGCRSLATRSDKPGAQDGASAQDGTAKEGERKWDPRPDLGPDSGEMKRGGDNVQFTWRSAIFTTVMCLGCLGYYELLNWRKQDNSRATTTQERLGTPKLGGPFELLDRTGKTVTEKDFLGQYLMIYFGFTFCPDICPQEMEKQTQAIELLDAEFGPVATPIFISVDPARDKPPQVNEYCSEFHPRIAGLTGTPEQVKKVSRAYRVYFNEGIRNSDEDYLIDHSIIHYFVGKNGKFIDFFGKNMTAMEMATKMRTRILEDRARAKERKERRGVESADEEEE